MPYYRPAYQFANPHPSVAAIVRWPVSADEESSEYLLQQSWSLCWYNMMSSPLFLYFVGAFRCCQEVAPLRHEHQNTGWRSVHQADGPLVRPQVAGPPHRRL